jgi:hypothetical protein
MRQTFVRQYRGGESGVCYWEVAKGDAKDALSRSRGLEMVRAALSVDESRARPFGFVKPPKLGDRIGMSRRGAPIWATITGLSIQNGPDGRGTLLVMARSA